MSGRIKKSKPKKEQETQVQDDTAVPETDTEILDYTDELLDEIDSLLEENAEQFINGYVQRGGE